jgi:hypothetical protein
MVMVAESLHGFAEALVSAGASVGAEAAVGQDLVIGGRFKLASHCRKDGYYAKRRWYRPYRSGPRHRPWNGTRSRPRQRQNGWTVRRRTGRKLYMPELCCSSPSCRRPALQCKKLSKMWYENDKSLILFRKEIYYATRRWNRSCRYGTNDR